MGNISCPVCSTAATVINHGPSYGISCPRCGKFIIGDIAAHEITSWSLQQKINLSGWIRENQNCEIYSPKLKGLVDLRSLTVGEKAEKILFHFARGLNLE